MLRNFPLQDDPPRQKRRGLDLDFGHFLGVRLGLSKYLWHDGYLNVVRSASLDWKMTTMMKFNFLGQKAFGLMTLEAP